MASVLDLVKHYQHTIEKYPHDEQKVMKCIDKLFHLGVTVQHLQATGVGRTVNALRKEPGDVGQAARSLVYKWKLMVAAEESDQEGDHNNDATSYNGHGNEKDSDDNTHQIKNKDDQKEKRSSSKIDQKDYKHMNGSYSGSKRKYHSTDEEEPEMKKSKHSVSSDNYDRKRKQEVHVKSEASDSSQDTYNSDSEDSSTDKSKSSDNEQKANHKIKSEPLDKHKLPSSKHSSHSNHDYKKEDSKKLQSSSKQLKPQSSELKYSSKEKTHISHKHKSSKDNESSSEKKHKSDHKSTRNEDYYKEESNTSSKHSSTEKHKSSSQKADSTSDKHKSHSEKIATKLEKHAVSSHLSKPEKEKQKSSSDKEMSCDKHKSKSKSASSTEKHTSSSKDKEKDKSSNSKHKSTDSHKSEHKHSSTNDSKSKSDSKSKHDKNDEKEREKRHKSSSSSSHKSNKSNSAKLKEDEPKKKSQNNNNEDSEDGIDSGSGASFAEALGMIGSAKPKKKMVPTKDTSSPNSTFSNDMSPSALLAPTAKLPPLPILEISALPEISPNYKPRPPPKLLPHFSDEDAMNAVISSKNQRTKVYSGNKVVGKLPTLYEMCVQVLQEHIDALEYTGGVPYDILKPVIDKASPHQLSMLEHYNPYLMEDTNHLWEKFCVKHFRNKKRQEMETWREMYNRCQEEQELKLKSLTANIKIAQEAKKAPIKQTKMAYVDTIVKPPRNIARKQALHGTARATTASPAARVASLASAPNVLQKGSVRPPTAAPVSVSSFNKPKKAPLMQKALQFMRGRKR